MSDVPSFTSSIAPEGESEEDRHTREWEEFREFLMSRGVTFPMTPNLSCEFCWWTIKHEVDGLLVKYMEKTGCRPFGLLVNVLTYSRLYTIGAEHYLETDKEKEQGRYLPVNIPVTVWCNHPPDSITIY